MACDLRQKGRKWSFTIASPVGENSSVVITVNSGSLGHILFRELHRIIATLPSTQIGKKFFSSLQNIKSKTSRFSIFFIDWARVVVPLSFFSLIIFWSPSRCPIFVMEHD